MTTVAQLIDSCSGMLHSYTGTIEATTFLTQSLSPTDTAVPVQHPTRLLQGIIEIDDELMFVSDVGDASATLFPQGRGYQNTTAVSHPINSMVTNDPLIPRARIFEEIQATIRQLSDLFQVKTATVTSSAVVNTYPLPADCRQVLQVQYQSVGPSNEWPSVYRWTHDFNADATTFPTGKSITIDDCLGVPGQPLQITYAADLGVPAATTDSLETLGIPPEMHDILRYGACGRAVQVLAPGRLNIRSVEAQTLAQGVTVDSVTKVAQQFFALFQERREEERKRLKLMYPPRKHQVR